MRLKIGVIYFIPVSSKKYSIWNDGFTAAMDLLKDDFDIEWFNLDESFSIVEVNSCDILFIKSNWGWKVDMFVQDLKKQIKAPKYILISGSAPIPSRRHASTYTHLFFETPWYADQIPSFYSSSLAFGINSKIYKPLNLNEVYDYISVGALKYYKRHHFLLKKRGRKLIVGDIETEEGDRLLKVFEANSIEVQDYQSPEALNQLINRSKIVYIPAELHGGGERALMEARACERDAIIEKDNPKLQSLLDIGLLDHNDYSDQLKSGIINTI